MRSNLLDIKLYPLSQKLKFEELKNEESLF